MKKYLLGSSAIILAIAFSAFITKPTATNVFRYKKTSFTSTQVATLSNWDVKVSSICTSGSDKACEIVVDDVYTHEDALGVEIFNTHNYVSSLPPGTTELEMTIAAIDDNANNLFKVDSTGTTATTVINKN
jgi:hypothetical protein